MIINDVNILDDKEFVSFKDSSMMNTLVGYFSFFSEKISCLCCKV